MSEIPEATSLQPIREWLERNALDPKKVVGVSRSAEDASALVNVTVKIIPDDFLSDWVASLGFDLNDVTHVHVNGTTLEVTRFVRNETGKIALAGPPGDSVLVTEVVKIRLTS